MTDCVSLKDCAPCRQCEWPILHSVRESGSCPMDLMGKVRVMELVGMVHVPWS
jgi:hypothetical protein